jgi:hypothetical protein
VSKHEDVLRDERKRIEQTLADPLQRMLLDDEAIPRCERVRDAIGAVLAEVESLREQLAEAIHENVKLSVEGRDGEAAGRG